MIPPEIKELLGFARDADEVEVLDIIRYKVDTLSQPCSQL